MKHYIVTAPNESKICVLVDSKSFGIETSNRIYTYILYIYIYMLFPNLGSCYTITNMYIVRKFNIDLSGLIINR